MTSNTATPTKHEMTVRRPSGPMIVEDIENTPPHNNGVMMDNILTPPSTTNTGGGTHRQLFRHGEEGSFDTLDSSPSSPTTSIIVGGGGGTRRRYRDTVSHFTLVRNIFIHSMIAATFITPLFAVVNRYCLYEFYVGDTYANRTFASLSTTDRVRFTAASSFGSTFFYLLEYVLLISFLQSYKSFTKGISVVIIVLSWIGAITLEYTMLQYMPEWKSIVYTTYLVICTIITFMNIVVVTIRTIGKDSLRYVMYSGVSFLLGSAYITGLMFLLLKYKDVFMWISPFVVPVTAFLIRYWGQRSTFPESSISKLSTTISVSSSVISRLFQCSYISMNTNFPMFLALEVFYDVVGVFIRVTLHYRQTILNSILAKLNFCCCCKQQTMSPTTPAPQESIRGRLISSQCVVFGCITELISFMVMYGTKCSLIQTEEFIRGPEGTAGTLIGLFAGCVVFQLICYFITNMIVWKVEAVPLHTLDLSVSPWKKLFSNQLYLISVVITMVTGYVEWMYSVWF